MSTFETVAGIIADTCDLERDTITPDSHAINDLGIDSLDMLDVNFNIEKAFDIRIPSDQWRINLNEGRVSPDAYYILKNLCAEVDELVAAKVAQQG